MRKLSVSDWLSIVSIAISLIGMGKYFRAIHQPVWVAVAYLGLTFPLWLYWRRSRKAAKYFSSLVDVYIPIVERIYVQHNRMATVVASDEEILVTLIGERPDLNTDALKKAICGWREQRERRNKVLGL
jgi:hypothetical protein